MDDFAVGTRHLMLGMSSGGEQRRGFGSVAVHRIQHQLHLLDPDIFPHLPYDMPVEGEPEPVEFECQTLMTYHLRPFKKLDCNFVPVLKPQEYIDESLSQNGLKSSLDELKLTLADLVPISDRKYPKITFLGTGSCIPNKTRNTSAILVELEYVFFIPNCLFAQ